MTKKAFSLLIILLMLTSVLCTGAVAEDNFISVSVCAYDYNAVSAGLSGASYTGIIMEQEIKVPAGTATTAIAEKAFTAAGITAVGADSGYVSSIGSLSAGTGGGYSGWCLAFYDASEKTFDDFSNSGMAYISMDDGDRIEFHYSVNADCSTDDIGNGWYGLPIFNSITVDGTKLTLTKSTQYDENWNSVTYYYADGNLIKGSGSQSDPFIIKIPVAQNVDLTSVSFACTPSLNEHYGKVSGVSDKIDLTKPALFSLSSLGGNHISYYRLTVATAYADTDVNAWYYDAVDSAVKAGIITPDLSNRLFPEKIITRGEFVSALYSLSKDNANYAEPDFTDVSDPQLSKAVAWAAANGITNGTSSASFAPNEPITRQQMITMLYRYAKPSESVSWDTIADKYSDSSEVQPYAANGVAWAVSTGLINGTGNSELAPSSLAARCEMCALILRFTA